MRYPKEIQLGGHIIKIELVDGEYVDEIDKHVADFCRDTNSIRVSLRTEEGGYRTLSFINLCLHHELIEAINEIFVVGMGEGCEKENKVDAIAQGYLQILEQLKIRLIDVESSTQGTA